MKIPAIIFVASQICAATPSTTFSITPEQQKHIDYLRKFDSVWIDHYPYIKFYVYREFRIIRVYNSSDLNCATENRFFYFDFSKLKFAPIEISPNAENISNKEINYGGSNFELKFEFAIPQK